MGAMGVGREERRPMRVVVIGGTGHVGTYLVPRLGAGGHEGVGIRRGAGEAAPAPAAGGKVRHFLHTGTVWVHGPTVEAPTTEEQPRRPFGEYGIQKAAIEDYLLGKARRDGFPATVVHPGHIVGPGWAPVGPAGNF